MKFSNMELYTEKNSIQITSRFVDKISDNIIVGDVVATVLKYGIENCFLGIDDNNCRYFVISSTNGNNIEKAYKELLSKYEK